MSGTEGTFDNSPSLNVYRIQGNKIAAQASAGAAKLLMIRDAKINVATVDQYTSEAKKAHITFQFAVNGKNYQAIVYDGDRKENTASLLRSGRATLYGTWTTYKGSPSLVVQRVEQ